MAAPNLTLKCQEMTYEAHEIMLAGLIGLAIWTVIRWLYHY